MDSICNDKPLVSIITVTYNCQEDILDTMQSVLSQSYDNYEYIIIDGASTDHTIDHIRKYQKKFGGKMRYISEKDNGIYDAMNKGLSMCQGKLIGIINSNDWYEIYSVEKAVETHLSNPSSVIYGILRTIKDEKEFKLERLNYEFLEEGMIQHPTCFVPLSIYKKFGFFDTKYKYVADYDLMLRLKRNNVHFQKLDDILANFRLGGASAGNNAAFEKVKFLYRNDLINKKRYMLKCFTLLIQKLMHIF